MEKAIALYIPVLHEGYRLFLEKHHNAKKLFLFDQQFLRHWPDFDYLKKDIRALDSQLMKQAIKQIFPHLEITIIKEQKDWQEFLLWIKNNQRHWIISNDDFGRYLAQEILQEQKISISSYFLRWDRSAVELAHQEKTTMSAETPLADRIIDQAGLEKEMMKDAFVQANYSNDWWRQVGAIFAKKGKTLISTYNQHLPSAQEQHFNGDPRSLFSSGEAIELSSSIHAEAFAVARAAAQGIALAGTDLYVTTFPCPICAKLIAKTGIKRLYFSEGYAVLDGLAVLKSAKIEIIQVRFSKKEQQQLLKTQQTSSNAKKRYS